MCSRAQWEIRELLARCRESLEARFPLVAKYMVVKCHPLAMGYCDEESRSCGFRPRREEIIPADADCPPGPGLGRRG